MTRTPAEIMARKRDCIDSTDDESAAIKGYFDTYHPIDTDEGRIACDLFPTEASEWFDECDRGYRPQAAKP